VQYGPKRYVFSILKRQIQYPPMSSSQHLSAVIAGNQGATHPMTGTELIEFLGLPAITRSL
jgi:hypothetical protein